MEINAILEIINANPAYYFIAGLVLGFFIRGIVLNGFGSGSHNKKPNRYQSKKTDSPVSKSTVVTADLNEPSFDWPELSKTVTPRRFASIPLDQPGNQV